MRYFIEFSYRGTAYNGWQKQNNALGVQEVLEAALAKVLRAPVEVTGSSRTDAGVHAEQQFAHFDLPAAIPDVDLMVYKLNALVPKDIAVQRLIPVAEDVHSRFAATHRKYEYRITFQKNPFLTDLATQMRRNLDVPRMNEAAALLLAHNDFESFSKIHTNVNNFRCTITESRWVEVGEMLVFHVKANRFLRGMVRALVGTMLEVGRQKITVDDFEQIILSRNRKNAGAQAPAEGLFLVEVGYPASLLG
ncbi:tRNA pseudouridine(38-40) synthase TruA [Dyadobacter fermentans]|uniref:tRNA pseudouridine synthase A n=1 Tax=Dyadobacter fermentans (strain ATCC 700827 / DSM 18053 / CIP 107007 / KCTC 52180 / NS114) TaxID=471854 RepID=C6W1J0_DYAFD|nr:tRNA pseudouridine(38-40) synthase TruA [Dyadobacter fermentans]ACT93720.1 tRNA pseudouridine synthase A [Dyadobacter fermentans DSM 18053]